MTPDPEKLQPKTLAFQTHAPEETEQLGRTLAAVVPLGTVIALRGELGAGKTCLVRGIAAQFLDQYPSKRPQRVSSPTFTLVNQYGDVPTLYHMDLYRITTPAELADLGYEDLFEPEGLTVIEWAERAEPLLPPRRIEVHLEHVAETVRRIQLTDHGILLQDGYAALAHGFPCQPETDGTASPPGPLQTGQQVS